MPEWVFRANLVVFSPGDRAVVCRDAKGNEFPITAVEYSGSKITLVSDECYLDETVSLELDRRNIPVWLIRSEEK